MSDNPQSLRYSIEPPKKESILKAKVFGMPIYFAASILAIIYAAIFTGILPTDIFGTVIMLFAIGFIFGELGERIPIWNEYCGGGAVLAFLGASAMLYFKLMPEKYGKAATFFYDEFGFQTLFISLLIVSSVLAVNRKQLLRAFVGYIPAIFGGLICAFIFGVIGGLITGVSIKEVVTLYVLPIMGGGNGAGAVPLSEMYQQVTGKSKAEYYSAAIAILTIANNFAIIGAVLLKKLGNARPSMTGNGELLRKSDTVAQGEKGKVDPATQREMAIGLVITGAFYAVAVAFGKVLLPKIGLVTIHFYAYMVIFVAIANLLDIIPSRFRLGAKQLTNFFNQHLTWMIMAGIGIAFTDLGDFVKVLNVQTIVIGILVVLGSIIGSGAVGYLFGFYPVEAALSAGLCMANRGGSGDLQVLGAANRMELMSYAAISSRIGGGIVLVIASIVFSLT